MNVKEHILERVQISNEKALSNLLVQNLKTQTRLNSQTLEKPIYELKIQHFLRSLTPLVGEFKKKEAMKKMVDIIACFFDYWDYELSAEECFMLYQLKDKGSFRLKDQTFFQELQKKWQEYPEYEVDESDFKQSLKDFKNLRLIELRRGSFTFSNLITLR